MRTIRSRATFPFHFAQPYFLMINHQLSQSRLSSGAAPGMGFRWRNSLGSARHFAAQFYMLGLGASLNAQQMRYASSSNGMHLKTHRDLIGALRKMDLPHDEKGCCYGYAGTVVSAILCGDISAVTNIFNDTANETDQRDFLRSISIHHSLRKNAHLFTVKPTKNQDQDIETSSQIVQPKKSESRGGVRRVFSQTGIYADTDLFWYLECISASLKPVNLETTPFAITIQSNNHIIALTLQSTGDERNWAVFDANLLPDFAVLPKNHMLNVKKLFGKQGDFAMLMELYCAKEDVGIYEGVVQTLQTIPEWIELHTVTEERAKKTELGTHINWLYFAAFNGNYALAKELILAGAEVNRKISEDLSPLEAAVYRQYDDVVELLIKQGAKDTVALYFAVNQDNVALLEVCFQYLASEEDKNKYYVQMLLTKAVHQGSVKCLEYLISLGGKVDIIYVQKKTVLMFAAEKGLENVVQILLNHDAKKTINHVDDFNKTALFYASSNGHTQLVQLLAENGATFNCKYAKSSPLQFARKNKLIESELILLREGAGLCHCDDSGHDTVTVFDPTIPSQIRILNHQALKSYLTLNPEMANKYYDRFKTRQDELKSGVFACIEEVINAIQQKTNVNYSDTKNMRLFSTAAPATCIKPANDGWVLAERSHNDIKKII